MCLPFKIISFIVSSHFNDAHVIELFPSTARRLNVVSSLGIMYELMNLERSISYWFFRISSLLLIMFLTVSFPLKNKS